MGVIQEFFNNREIAIGIWVIIGLAVILPTKPARQFIKTAIPISKSEQKKMKWQVIRFSGINLSKVSAIRKSPPNTIVCCRTSNDLQINLKKLARRLDLQIGENYG